MKNINIANLNVNEQFPIVFDECATFVDFVQDTWVFVVKDDFYSDEELKMLRQQKANIDVVLRYDVLIFLLEITDILDVSDFYFNALDIDKKLIEDAKAISRYAIFFIDQNNVIQVMRCGDFAKDDSQRILQMCQEQITSNCSEEEFVCNMEGVMSSMQPFELQKYAQVHCSL